VRQGQSRQQLVSFSLRLDQSTNFLVYFLLWGSNASDLLLNLKLPVVWALPFKASPAAPLLLVSNESGMGINLHLLKKIQWPGGVQVGVWGRSNCFQVYSWSFVELGHWFCHCWLGILTYVNEIGTLPKHTGMFVRYKEVIAGSRAYSAKMLEPITNLDSFNHHDHSTCVSFLVCRAKSSMQYVLFLIHWLAFCIIVDSFGARVQFRFLFNFCWGFSSMYVFVFACNRNVFLVPIHSPGW
jgi:hypothetical protein